MTTTVILATGSTTSEKDFFRWPTSQIEFLERHGRDGWYIPPTCDCLRRQPARETKPLIGQIILELISKNFQGQGVKVLANGIANEVKNLCVHLNTHIVCAAARQ